MDFEKSETQKQTIYKPNKPVQLIMKQIIKLLTLLIVLATFSCNGNQNNSYYSEMAFDTSLNEELNTSENTPVSERKVIKEGQINFESADLKQTKALIDKSVAEFKGYIASENVYNYDDKTEYSITVKVPADKFELLIEHISASAKKLDRKDITIQDVTEEYIDLDARIKTKKELENRYRELLKQANRVDEILNIEREIGSLRSDIESIEGRFNYLSNRISLSTLSVTFYEKTRSAFGFISKIGEAVQNGWTNLLWFFVAIVNLWAFILLGVLVFFLVSYLRKRKRNKVKQH